MVAVIMSGSHNKRTCSSSSRSVTVVAKHKGKRGSEPAKRRRRPLPDLNEPALPDLNKSPPPDSSDDEEQPSSSSVAQNYGLIPRVPDDGCTAAASASRKRKIQEEGDQSESSYNWVKSKLKKILYFIRKKN